MKGLWIPIAILAAFVLFGMWAAFNNGPMTDEDTERYFQFADLPPEREARLRRDIEARSEVYRFCIARLPREDCAKIY